VAAVSAAVNYPSAASPRAPVIARLAIATFAAITQPAGLRQSFIILTSYVRLAALIQGFCSPKAIAFSA